MFDLLALIIEKTVLPTLTFSNVPDNFWIIIDMIDSNFEVSLINYGLAVYESIMYRTNLDFVKNIAIECDFVIGT